MRWAGNLRCFEWSCLATAVGYYLWGQSYRPIDAPMWRHTLQYAAIQVIPHALDSVSARQEYQKWQSSPRIADLTPADA